MLARLKGTKLEVTFQSNFIRPLLYFLGMSPAKLPFIDLKDTTRSSAVMYYNWFIEHPLNLENYRVVQVNCYKNMDSGGQHEQVVAKIATGKYGVYGYLCFERMRGDNPWLETDGMEFEALEHKNTEPTSRRPSKTASSVSSLDSIKVKTNAEDTVAQVNGFPITNSQNKSTGIQLVDSLNPDRELFLCDLIILTYTIHTHNPVYMLVKEQCYWFASMIMCILKRVYGHNGAPSLAMDEHVDEVRRAAGKWHSIPVHRATEPMLDSITSQFESNLKAFKERVLQEKLVEAQAKEDRLAREQGRVARVIHATEMAR